MKTKITFSMKNILFNSIFILCSSISGYASIPGIEPNGQENPDNLWATLIDPGTLKIKTEYRLYLAENKKKGLTPFKSL